jgi:hypothetical protein
MGAIGIGRSIIHLHVYTPNLLDAEAPYQGFKDFASSITLGEVESMGTSTREMEKLPLRTAWFSVLSCGQENLARPPNHPVSPKLAKSPI